MINVKAAVMIVRKDQLVRFSQDLVDAFIAKTVEFLRSNFPDWVGVKDDEQLGMFIQEMIDLGAEHEIKKEINVQKLIYYKIRFNFKLPLHKKLLLLLTEKGIDEDGRTENFYFSLLTGSHELIRIDLETDIIPTSKW